ncbi:MAG: hypothetical protein Q7K33_03350 [Candidatus Berkelbacteria bacterium]|nr:hypothetical protein [Candidatus Berkelbacteria bacterium]
MKKYVVQIHPYGPWDPTTRTPEEMAGLEEYLAAVIKYIEEHHWLISAISVPGGMMSRNEVVECDSLAQEVEKRLTALCIYLPIFLDRSPTSTISIVESGFRFTEKEYPDDGLWLFCDKARRLKTRYLAWRLHNRVRYKVFGFNRPDPNKRSRWYFQLAELVWIVTSRKAARRKIESLPERQKPN